MKEDSLESGHRLSVYNTRGEKKIEAAVEIKEDKGREKGERTERRGKVVHILSSQKGFFCSSFKVELEEIDSSIFDLAIEFNETSL